MEINWMEVWTQTSVPAVSLLGAFKSQLGDTSYCVFYCCLTALSSANQTSTWGFSLLIIQWLLSGLIGVFLHVRCIPHQNSQRCFWASVWFMLDSSRWHEPFGESFSKLRLDLWIDTFELVIRLSNVKQLAIFRFSPCPLSFGWTACRCAWLHLFFCLNLHFWISQRKLGSNTSELRMTFTWCNWLWWRVVDHSNNT